VSEKFWTIKILDSIEFSGPKELVVKKKSLTANIN